MYPYRSRTVDPKRLHALHGASLLDPERQPALERATRTLAAAFGVEIAFVGVVERGKVALTATLGIDLANLGPQPGFCITTIAGSEPRIVPDTLRDPLTASHPLVIGPWRVRFYAGVPLMTREGFTLGTLAVADTRPRDVTAQQRQMLRDIAAMVMQDFEAAVLQDIEEDVYRISRMLENFPVAHFTSRLDGTILTWSAEAESIFGYEPSQIIGQHISILAQHKTYRELTAALAAAASRQRVPWFDAVRVTRTGDILDTQDSAWPIFSSHGDVVGVAWAIRDVSELRRLEALVWETRERFDVVADTVLDAVVMTDVAGNVEYVNPSGNDLTGWSTTTARGRNILDVVDLVHEESLERIEHPVQICLRQSAVVGPSRNALVVHRDGRTFSIEHVTFPIHHRDGSIVGTVMIFHQLAGEPATVRETAYLSSHDRVTGLPNRQELENQIERALVTAARENVEHVLLVLTIPQYTAVQVRQGQIAANELIKQVTARLRGRIRESDLLARFEEDRLAVLLTHCSRQQAARIAGELVDAVRNYRFVWDDRTTVIGLSTMLLPVDADVRNAATLLDLPELAGDIIISRQQPDGWNENQRAATTGRLGAERMITDALAREKFRLYAQKISPLSPAQHGAEIYEFLVHMLDDDGRVLPPSVFIEAAARDHLAVDLDRWVVGSALAGVASHSPSPAAVWMINLSLPSMCDPEFPVFIREQLELRGVAPWQVGFEIPETVAIENLANAMRFIGEMRTLGCRVALSQFGSSLHTFSYLRNLDVNYIKIDGSVIRDIVDDVVDRAVVGAIGHIAHTMGIQTIAEHVESVEVLECLKDLAIDYAQGYAVSKPVPLAIIS
jgi:PAS domain S-box-containing protein/diguanylate cyclase (GGDEF)-like protein